MRYVRRAVCRGLSVVHAFLARLVCGTAAAAALCIAACAPALVGSGPALPSQLNPWQADSIVVRGILDTNGLRTVPIETVARVEHGRVVALVFGRQTAVIHVLPAYVGGLSQLRELALTDCGLRTLPREIDYLDRLYLLRLDRNRLVNLPEEICELPGLRDLSLSHNLLVELPEALAGLRQLRVLDVSYNRLSGLPESIGALAALRALSLSHNRLTGLPQSLGGLDSLLTLKLDHNSLVSLPDQIGRLPSLRILQAANNRLARVTDELEQLRTLSVLQLAYNDLLSLPAGLGRSSEMIILDITGNRIASLSERYADPARFPRLATLALDNNRLCSAPPALSAWLERLSPSWRSRQLCGGASGGGMRLVTVGLGDSVEIDGQIVEFLAYKELERRTYLLVRSGGHAAVYQPGARIGHDEFLSRVSRLTGDPPRRSLELSVDRRFLPAPPAPGRYEIVGVGSSVSTAEVGEITLESVAPDSAFLVFAPGLRRLVRPAQSISLAWEDLRATLTCRWVFHDGRGRPPEFYPDSVPPVSAVGFDIDLQDRTFRPRAADRQAAIAADPSAIVEIYDLGGRLLATSPYARADELTASMPNGSYLRRFTGGGETVWDRFFVNR